MTQVPPKDEANYFVYVVRCSDDSLYTGYTSNIDRRLSEHNRGEASKYTRARTPVHLQYYEGFNDRGDAMSREHEIKQLSKQEKEELVSKR